VGIRSSNDPQDDSHSFELETEQGGSGAAAGNDHQTGDVEVQTQVTFEEEAGEENKAAKSQANTVFSLHRWRLVIEDL